MEINVQTVCSFTAASLATFIGAYLYLTTNKKRRIPKTWVEVGKVTKLLVYPLKSGQRIELKTAECSKHGLVSIEKHSTKLRDRSFVVYNEVNQQFVSSKTHKKILSIEVSIHDKDHMVFDAPKQRPLYVKIPEDEPKLVSMSINHDEEVSTIDCGDEAAAWLSRYLLNQPSGFRLCYHDGSSKKTLNNSDMKMCLDLSGYHLINEASIDKLNCELEVPISADNFRPNIMVQGEMMPAFSEEFWDWIRIGDVLFRNVKFARRIMADSQAMEQLEILKEDHRLNREGITPVIGINMDLERSGTIKVGESVFISQ